MKLTLDFDPQKATLGFLVGVVRFTDDPKVLEMVLDLLDEYNLGANFEKEVSSFSEESENSQEYIYIVKTLIVKNPASTQAMHEKLLEDEDLFVRWNLLNYTRFTSIIDKVVKSP